MKNAVNRRIFILLTAALLIQTAALAETITENTTWSGTVVLNSTVTLQAGVVLTIEPQTEIQMNTGVSIIVNGQLLAEGTEANPIRFTHTTAGIKWERIQFINADDSRLIHCIIEYSNCQGDHKDYYDNDCDSTTAPPSRSYHEAVVIIASGVVIESCVFQNLPNNTGSREGDALAVISDDPDHPGKAWARIRDCQFLSIGQGVHTRFSYVLVENCYFTDHHGDNDDVDLYGESTPAPLILNNLFLNPAHDDMINPTLCSAVIIGNIIAGSDDHGVVLRDKSRPIMINNLIYDCSSAGVAVQNQCDALIVNNTIVNCGRGIRFFDHTGRWGPPYCLNPGSGKATIINTIIWDCPTSILLTNSPSTEDPGSHAAVRYCDIEGGQAGVSVSSKSTLTWGPGNINVNPQFVSIAGDDYHLKSQAGRWDSTAQSWLQDATHSPCIDAGTPVVISDPNFPFMEIDWRGELWPHGGQVNMGTYGATTEASWSNNSAVGNIADIDLDGSVQMPDFTLISEKWNLVQPLLREDLNRNGLLDLPDLLLFGQNWLWMQ